MSESGVTDVDEFAFLVELESWLHDNWDPDRSLRVWWERLGRAGWARPHWPVEWCGKGLTVAQSTTVAHAIRRFGAAAGPSGFGANMGGPTLLAHGNDDQRRRHLPGMVTGADAYCQLFSEPNAGSDLAGLQTRAERDGDLWVLNGQKVWSSRARTANRALLVARTDRDAAKHAGMSFFIVDMEQPGVEVRPLREMTGRSYFNEVFLTDARVPDADLIGGQGNGWKVASTTLAFERALSSGLEESLSAPEPGGSAGNLDRPAGEFVTNGNADAEAAPASAFHKLAAVAATTGRAGDPAVRDALVRLYILERLNTLTNGRARDLQAAGGELPGFANLAKMSQNHAVRLGRDLTFSILGVMGTLHGYDDGSARALAAHTGLPALPDVIYEALWAQAPPIYGGSDQMQRNIVGERVLGLAREPGPDRNTPFRALLKN